MSELKLSLEEPGYRRFLEYMKANVTQVAEQWSVFFAPKDHPTCDKVIVLRSSQSKGSSVKWTVIVKQKRTIVRGIITRKETKCQVDDAVAQRILTEPSKLFELAPPEVQKLISGYCDLTFCVIGDMRTIRRLVCLDDVVLMCDESTLANSSKFFEIEVQTGNTREAKEKIQRMLLSIGVTYFDSQNDKFGRLMSIPSSERLSRRFSQK